MSTLFYHFPELSKPDFGFVRGPGPGLGNLMFPIARALAAQNEMGGIFVFPTMRQIKVGTILRREKDKRTYGELFRPRSMRETKDWIRARCLSKCPAAVANARVFCYRGLARQFYDIEGSRDVVRQFLEATSRFPVLEPEIDLAIHVRLGDFAAPSATATLQSTQVPLSWYRDALHKARDIIGIRSIRSVLFTDEDPSTVISKLRVYDLKPEPQGNALTSLLLMSRAKVLIGSRSTFSLWGQYLGDSTAIWPRGFELERYKRPDPKKDIFL